jgi:poly-gamma-glutamate synthesis protein (capsule biosynthesis protein)
MTGRGIDQILGRPSDPTLHESYVKDARRYVELAEAASGPVPRGVEPAYVWGDALAELEGAHPDAFVVNLETSVTRSDAHWPGKAVCYRMHPANVGVLGTARVSACALANNHVLDYGRDGLLETLDTLARAAVRTSGAGRTLHEAREPAVVELPGARRLLFFALGAASSGIPQDWAATPERPGVDLLDVCDAAADALAERIARAARTGDVVVASIHWGGNWGWTVPSDHVRFAHRLVDAGVAVVHGHSSHHVRPIEIYRGRPILYGCGDFIDDYEGIGADDVFHPERAALYVATFAAGGGLERLRLYPLRERRLSLRRAAQEDARALAATLEEISREFRTRVVVDGDETLRVEAA